MSVAPGPRQTTFAGVTTSAAVVCAALSGLYIQTNLFSATSSPKEAVTSAISAYPLGEECYQVARALASGRGYSDPFGTPTGPTSWTAPALPTLLAGLVWAIGDDRQNVMTVVLLLQQLVLIATAALVLVLARETAGR